MKKPIVNPPPGALHPYNPGVPAAQEGFIPKFPNQAAKKFKCPYKGARGQRGYLDENDEYWVPTNPRNAHGGPHWDVQGKDGYRNVRPLLPRNMSGNMATGDQP